MNAVFKLSRKSGRFPQSLQLSHIQDLTHTEFHGRFGWIYQGQLNGRLVAVKKVAEGERHSPEQSKVSNLNSDGDRSLHVVMSHRYLLTKR